MPFTFAHPSIVLPLAKASKGRLSATGLIIGSMMPDFEYFIRFSLKSEISHTVFGMFFCLPLAMYQAKAFHLVVRNQLIDAFPNFLYQRFVYYKEFDWREYKRNNRWWIYLSVLIGVLSHLVWDGFTHANTFITQGCPFGVNATADIGDLSIPLYKVMQHGGTLLGSGYIYNYVKRMPRNLERNENPYWLAFWLVWLILQIAYLAIHFCNIDYFVFGNLVAVALSGSMLSLMLTSCLFKYFPERSRS